MVNVIVTVTPPLRFIVTVTVCYRPFSTIIITATVILTKLNNKVKVKVTVLVTVTVSNESSWNGNGNGNVTVPPQERKNRSKSNEYFFGDQIRDLS